MASNAILPQGGKPWSRRRPFRLLLSCAGRSGPFQVLPGEERLELRIFLDRSVVEVYAGGRAVLTASGDWLGLGQGGLCREGGCAVTLLARGGRALASAVDLWEMGSIWG